MSKQDQFTLAYVLSELEPGAVVQHRLFVQALLGMELDSKITANQMLHLCAQYGKMYQLCQFLGVSDPDSLIQEFNDKYGGSQ